MTAKTILICVQCAEIVGPTGINDSYNGMKIHHGVDWYCGPVVDVATENADDTLEYLVRQKKRLDRLDEIEINRSNGAWKRRETIAARKAARMSKQ